MTMQISIQGNVHVVITTSGRYSPDVMHDIKNRSVEAYRAALDLEYPDVIDAEVIDESGAQ